jgi:hypothetical protein
MASEKEFIDKYIPAFLGAYAAQDYVRNCSEGWTNQTQPVEDAICLAKQAWVQLTQL